MGTGVEYIAAEELLGAELGAEILGGSELLGGNSIFFDLIFA